VTCHDLPFQDLDVTRSSKDRLSGEKLIESRLVTRPVAERKVLAQSRASLLFHEGDVPAPGCLIRAQFRKDSWLAQPDNEFVLRQKNRAQA
jgi:hypothetical protein